MKQQTSRSASAHLAKASFGLVVAVLLGMYLPQSARVEGVAPLDASAAESMDVWWPVDGAKVSGLQPFKSLVPGRSVNDYEMYWQVDHDRMNRMETSNDGYPHKEAAVDLSGWNWKGSGPYTITFIAKDRQGSVISEKSVNLTIENSSVPPVINSTAAPITNVSPVSTTPSGPEVKLEPIAFSPHVGAAVNPLLAPTTSSGLTTTAAKTRTVPAPAKLSVWWPTAGATLSGTQPFKAVLDGTDLKTYIMTWQVDAGSQNPMVDSQVDAPHKEAVVDLSSWNWKGSGPYALTFTAKAVDGTVLGTQSVSISVAPSFTAPSAIAPQSLSVSAPAPTVSASGNPFAGATLYVDPYADAKRQANEWRNSRPSDAALMDKIGNQASTFWMGGWNSDIQGDAARLTAAAAAQGAMPVFVAYNIPFRDCGSYSAGGVNSPEEYKRWIRGLAAGIGSRKAAVILEPDALSNIDCLGWYERQVRIELLKDAVGVFKAQGNSVYLDAGNPRWIGADEMARRLASAGIAQADGFSLNISNFFTDADNIAFGTDLSKRTGGKHFVVDSSRNGLGPAPDYEWCNPSGRALGRKPTTATGHALVDAFLWVKGPGGSDGSCNGAPSAGIWWPEYALGLAQRASW